MNSQSNGEKQQEKTLLTRERVMMILSTANDRRFGAHPGLYIQNGQ
jgi:hypothetical protein